MLETPCEIAFDSHGRPEPLRSSRGHIRHSFTRTDSRLFRICQCQGFRCRSSRSGSAVTDPRFPSIGCLARGKRYAHSSAYDAYASRAFNVRCRQNLLSRIARHVAVPRFERSRGLQQFAQSLPSLVQLRLRISRRVSTDFGNLAVLVTLHIVQNERLLIAFRQLVDGCLEGDAVHQAS